MPIIEFDPNASLLEQKAALLAQIAQLNGLRIWAVLRQ